MPPTLRRFTAPVSNRCQRDSTRAAKVLGYSKQQTFVKIILPQVIKRILPAVTNEVITLVKDTSLAFALAYMEMFTICKADSGGEHHVCSVYCSGSLLLCV